jgi:hypothetical protein
VRPELAIDYHAGMRTLSGESLDAIVQAIREEMPATWIDRYHRMCDGPTNVLEVPLRSFSYLFDYCTELMDEGVLPAGAREDRTVAAYGYSQAAQTKRDASRIKGFPGSDERGDRGHLAAHAAGGGLDINVFHQDAWLNRGWSPRGKRYREMERYCAGNEGTFFFSRLIYADATARPAEIEYGILRPDRSLWVEVFDNSGTR